MTSRTLNSEVVVEGVGIHTGAHARVTLRPAPPGAGIVFVRDGVEIAARAASVADTSRCTVLAGSGGGTVSTVEHLLSALSGLGVTDARAEVEGPELPIGDGSALPWVEALRSAGLVDGAAPAAAAPALTEPVLVTGKHGAFVAAYPADRFRATVATVFEDHPLVGTQVARFDAGVDDYARDVAPARTFGFIEEVEALRKAGLALGGSLENAVVVYPDRYSSPLRFEGELARHKLLDLLGDLSLAGLGPLPPVEVFAVKPSHRLNVSLAARLAAPASGTMA